MRSVERAADELRPVQVEFDFQPQAEGSVLLSMGNTQVLCSASVEARVPPFLEGRGQGWITAEYGMLPRATHQRGRREAVSGISGRTQEIQRLIGRSLRMMLDLHTLANYTIRVDCDVLNADGGTRCASITGAALAVQRAVGKMVERGQLQNAPSLLPVAAVSVGIVAGRSLLDLDYSEDFQAEVDANFIMSGDGRWIEVQTTAEGAPFSPTQFQSLAELATRGTKELFSLLWKRRASAERDS